MIILALKKGLSWLRGGLGLVYWLETRVEADLLLFPTFWTNFPCIGYRPILLLIHPKWPETDHTDGWKCVGKNPQLTSTHLYVLHNVLLFSWNKLESIKSEEISSKMSWKYIYFKWHRVQNKFTARFHG